MPRSHVAMKMFRSSVSVYIDCIVPTMLKRWASNACGVPEEGSHEGGIDLGSGGTRERLRAPLAELETVASPSLPVDEPASDMVSLR